MKRTIKTFCSTCGKEQVEISFEPKKYDKQSGREVFRKVCSIPNCSGVCEVLGHIHKRSFLLGDADCQRCGEKFYWETPNY